MNPTKRKNWMKKSNLLKYKNILLKLSEDIIAQKQDNTHMFSEKLPDVIDQSVDDSAKSLNNRFISRKKLYLKKIENALSKIKDGTYGVCENCGDDIDFKRLEARPVATLCIFCKQEKEKSEKIESSKSGFLKVWEDENE